MRKRIGVFICLLLVIITATVQAFGTEAIWNANIRVGNTETPIAHTEVIDFEPMTTRRYYTSRIDPTDYNINRILSLITRQNFQYARNTHYNVQLDVAGAQHFVEHFIRNTWGYIRVPNGGAFSSHATDGFYTATGLIGGQGCLHYARFIAQVMHRAGRLHYTGEGQGYLRHFTYQQASASGYQALDRRIWGSIPTGNIQFYYVNHLRDFILRYAQAGEHLRITNPSGRSTAQYSLTFLAANDYGFYTLQWYGTMNCRPFLSYITWFDFARYIDIQNRVFFIYDANPSINIPSNINFMPSTRLYIAHNGVSIRTGYYTSYPTLLYLNIGDFVNVNAWAYNSHGGRWYRAVNIPNTQRYTWIYGDHLSPTPIINHLPSTRLYITHDGVPVRGRYYQLYPTLRYVDIGDFVNVNAWIINSHGNRWYRAVGIPDLPRYTWVYSGYLSPTNPHPPQHNVTLRETADQTTGIIDETIFNFRAATNFDATRVVIMFNGGVQFNMNRGDNSRDWFFQTFIRVEGTQTITVHAYEGNTRVSSHSMQVTTHTAQQQTFTVTFVANNGTNNTATQTFVAGQPQILRLNTFTRAGYIFAGWSLTPTGTVRYTDGQNIDVARNERYYAVWRAIPPEITTTPSGTTAPETTAPGDTTTTPAGTTAPPTGTTTTPVGTTTPTTETTTTPAGTTTPTAETTTTPASTTAPTSENTTTPAGTTTPPTGTTTPPTGTTTTPVGTTTPTAETTTTPAGTTTPTHGNTTTSTNAPPVRTTAPHAGTITSPAGTTATTTPSVTAAPGTNTVSEVTDTPIAANFTTTGTTPISPPTNNAPVPALDDNSTPLGHNPDVPRGAISLGVIPQTGIMDYALWLASAFFLAISTALGTMSYMKAKKHKRKGKL